MHQRTVALETILAERPAKHKENSLHVRWAGVL